jgi:hypothetical protein
MEPVEQVFLHVRSVAGFRTVDVTATTEFVRVSDLTEIVGWFSCAETESVIRFDTLNIFFHPLPSGDYALGIISPAQRGFFSFFQPPKSFFVRILIIPPRTLLEKGNHPLALFDEFRRRRKIPIVSHAPKRLSPLLPLRSTELANRERFDAASRSPGPAAFAVLYQSLFDSECTLFHSSNIPPTAVLSVLFDLLPICYRTELTFSTELFFSLRTPFRAVGLSGSRRLAANQVKLLGIPAVFMDELMNEDVKKKSGFAKTLNLDPWSRFVYRILQTRNFSFLENHLKTEHQNTVAVFDENALSAAHWEDLHRIAVSRTKALNSTAVSIPERRYSNNETAVPGDREALRCFTAVEQLLPIIDQENETWIQQQTGLSSPNVLQHKSASSLLERIPRLLGSPIAELDSFVTRALFGDESVLPKIQTIWKSAGSQMAWDEKDMIREEYLSLIRSFLVHSPEGGRTRSVQRSSQLLDLMLIFLEK